MNKKIKITRDLESRQRLRMKRFGMAAITYVMVIVATGLVTRLGLGELSVLNWLIYIGMAVVINSVLFFLFYTGANLRFPEPSLTREQIILSALWGMIALYSLPEARPIVLVFFLPAFSFGMLRLNRREFLTVAAWVMFFYATLLIIEYRQDRPGFRAEYETFLYMIFSILLVWFAVFGSMLSDIRNRLGISNAEILKANEVIQKEVEERKQTATEKDLLIRDLKQALEQIETLSGLLPICSSCKRIRDDQGDWKQVEVYFREHSRAEFSHGICPECSRKLYPDFDIGKEKE